jgi:hypothetical protein
MHLQLPDFTVKDYVYPRLFPTPPAESAEEEHRGWYFYLAEISLRRLDTHIRNEIWRTRRPNNDLDFVELSEAVMSYEDQAAAWKRSLPDIISLQTPEEEDDVGTPNRRTPNKSTPSKRLVCTRLVCYNSACYNLVYNNSAYYNLVYDNLACYNLVCDNSACYNLVGDNSACYNLACYSLAWLLYLI